MAKNRNYKKERAQRDTNFTFIIGYVGRVDDMRYTPSGTAVLSMSVANNQDKTDKDGNLSDERTLWYRVTFWGSRAENLNEKRTLHKLKMVAVRGLVVPRAYEDKNGDLQVSNDFEGFPDVDFLMWKNDDEIEDDFEDYVEGAAKSKRSNGRRKSEAENINDMPF